MKSLATFIDRLAHATQIREGELGVKILKKDLASAADVSSSAVTLWYKGSTEELKAASLFGLARYLKVRPEWLWNKIGPMRDGDAPDAVADAPDELRSRAARAAVDALRSADTAGVSDDVFAAIEVLVNSILKNQDEAKDGHRAHLQP
ncbi:hypothetical protein [Burkholderia arboris]|uniref:hypothetical protein n=1 Tax=Burkholderia arboris TaxID=488730 RepID=UPI001CF17822|nr:hypothetical protein [Burkholderia arboris]MCA8492583.1 hypothetical protein [Burkholderia arboris]